MNNHLVPIQEAIESHSESRLGIPRYARDRVTIGVVHFGVGGFHRAHQARYLDEYMGKTQDLNWGICGVGLMPGDKHTIDSLNRQGCLYSLTEKSDQSVETRIIGSIVEAIHAPGNQQRVLDRLSDPNVRIVSMTVTEGGYRYDFEEEAFEKDHPDIRYDREHPEDPRTIFGFLWQAAKNRKNLGDQGKWTLLSCDNVPHNGGVLKKAFLSFLESADPGLVSWVRENTRFPNSMVDRITPAPQPADQVRVSQEYGIQDECAVGSEMFLQWVVEDDFANARPALEQVDVLFTENVTPYENAKLRLLNGSHLVMAYSSYLSGYTYVDEAIRDQGIRALVTQYMVQDAQPSLALIPGFELDPYIDTLMERFSNSQVSDQVQRICSDGFAKFKNYLLPLTAELIQQGKDTRRLSFTMACFCHYISGKDLAGKSLVVSEPNLDLSGARLSERPVEWILGQPSLFGGDMTPGQAAFVAQASEWYATIRNHGMRIATESCLKPQQAD